jgi:menaquinone-dependent protoporphyrinogen IX oxidase
MRALVVYESMYGNTHAIASNIADGLRSAYEVTLVPVAAATADLVGQADLLVVGGPTHMHGLSTSSSRQLAVKTAAKSAGEPALDPDAPGPGLRGWLGDLAGRQALAAAFDTRLVGIPVFTGRASRSVSRLLKRHGYYLVMPAESFLIGQQNVLVDGETSRARRWGAALGAAAAIAHAPAAA